MKLVKIYNNINESNKKLTKELTWKNVDRQSFRENIIIRIWKDHSIKSKCLKYAVKEILPTLQKHANTLFKV